MPLIVLRPHTVFRRSVSYEILLKRDFSQASYYPPDGCSREEEFAANQLRSYGMLRLPEAPQWRVVQPITNFDSVLGTDLVVGNSQLRDSYIVAHIVAESVDGIVFPQRDKLQHEWHDEESLERTLRFADDTHALIYEHRRVLLSFWSDQLRVTKEKSVAHVYA